MSLTKRAKRVSKERGKCNPTQKCLKCGASIRGKSHHFFCSKCYVPGLMYSKEMKNKIKKP